MENVHNRMPLLFTKKEAINYLELDKDALFSICLPLDDKIKMKIEKPGISLK